MLRRHRRFLARVALAIVLVIIAVGIAGAWWLLTPQRPDTRALDALTTDDMVAVSETSERIEFSPIGESSRVGVILYPGARIEPAAYAAFARMIAERGYLVVVVRMPYNLAVLDPERAITVLDDHAEVASWVMCGHSLGGAMAAQFVDRHRDRIDGLALLAAYPPSDTDLSDSDVAVVSTYGTFDGVLNARAFEKAIPRLPKDTSYVPIEGGNHAQFGDYGHQPGDNDAEISAEDQQNVTLQAIGSILLPLRIHTGGTRP